MPSETTEGHVDLFTFTRVLKSQCASSVRGYLRSIYLKLLLGTSCVKDTAINSDELKTSS